jgi:hypothetical protein
MAMRWTLRNPVPQLSPMRIVARMLVLRATMASRTGFALPIHHTVENVQIHREHIFAKMEVQTDQAK